MHNSTQTPNTGLHRGKVIATFSKSAIGSDIHRSLLEDGVVTIEGLLDRGTVDKINAELDPVLGGPQLGTPDDKVVGRTRRLNSTLRHSPTIVDKVAAHPVLIDAAESALLPYSDTIQLVSVASEVTPGEASQMLHRDDWNWGHIKGRSHPLSIFSIVALSEFSATSRATRVIPGSHRWDDAYEAGTNKDTWKSGLYEDMSFPRGLYDHLTIPALLQPGDAVMALGTTLHGAGPNTTTDVFRRGLQIKYCVGWLRPTTNNFLLYPPEFAKTLPETVQRLLGYPLEAKHIGMLEQGIDPIELLREQP